MLKCEECIHKFVCFILENKGYPQEECRYFKNRSQFVDMPVGKWIEAEQALKEHKQIIKEKRECRIN